MASMNENEITCDACDGLVPPRPREVPAGRGSVRMILACPHCQAEYPIAHITRRGLDLRDRLAVARRQARRDPSRLERVRELEAKYQAEVTKLDPTGGSDQAPRRIDSGPSDSRP